ncbi:MAG: hypothetical protein AAGA62_11190, partial [Bacteroidota bacterium]
FARAVARKRTIRTMNMRGISDLLSGKAESDKAGGQEAAMKNLMAFVEAFLNDLEFSDYCQPITDAPAPVFAPPPRIPVNGPTKASPPPDVRQDIHAIRDLIRRSKMKEAFRHLDNLSQNFDTDIQNAVMGLQQRWADLSSKELRGIISSSQATVTKNQIVHAMLETLNQMS